MIQPLPEFLGVFVALAIALAIALYWTRARATAPPALLVDQLGPVVFLYRADTLVDATPAARMILSRLTGDDRTSLLIWLEQKLPGVAHTLRIAEEEGMAEKTGKIGHGTAKLSLKAENLGDDTLRLTLIDPDSPEGGILVDPLAQNALEAEAAILRNAMDGAPILAWRQDAAGAITWANQAYLDAAEAHCEAHDISLWPLPRLIDLPSLAEDAEPQTERHALPGSEGEQWFECHMRPNGDKTIIFALPADAAVRAERSLREFVQTLSKTFADLPIGLAIFDRARNLQLFNPALIDLTNLSASLLIGRPSLYAFLDQLRENRIIPEPKDYRNWRRQIATLEAAAAEGHHVETWSLPGGQTYRVTGRPHPDGAIALLFEDITTEVTLTRKFRTRVSLGLDTLDALADAVAVFDSSNGQMVLANAAWRQIWGEDAPLSALGDQITRKLGEATGGLPRLCDHLASNPSPKAATGTLALTSGQLVQWRSTPMPSGRLMISFSGDRLSDIALPDQQGDVWENPTRIRQLRT